MLLGVSRSRDTAWLDVDNTNNMHIRMDRQSDGQVGRLETTVRQIGAMDSGSSRSYLSL